MSTSNNQNLNSLDLNPQFLHAFELLDKSSANVFLTGKAGTGKSTFLEYFREHTKKKIVVLAPTGVAALNVKGQTIHSFFNFKPDTTLESIETIRLSKNKREILEKVDTIVIDEISMVRADLLDCVDASLRLHGGNEKLPFGGVQMVFIGDLFQLPPVVRPNERSIFETVYQSPYFFDAKAFKDFPMEFIELYKNYRQKDEIFVGLLNAIRTNSIKEEQLNILNTRFVSNFQEDPTRFYIYLTTTNDLAHQLNYEKLHAISDELFTFEADHSGNFEEKNFPTQEELELKVGAQVMLLNNDQAKRWVNGSIGKVVAVEEARGMETNIRVELTDGARVDVTPYSWEIFNFFFNEDTQKIDSEIVGSFRQYPLKLAWAVTIHKSQGKTFDQVMIDLGRGSFSHGQTYVALSRCRSLEGIFLKRPIARRDILMDRRIPEFLIEYQYKIAGQKFPLEKKRALIAQAIEERRPLDIVYLKEKGEKNLRTILPKDFRTVEVNGQKCLGVEAFCVQRKQDWIFKMDCIVDIQNTVLEITHSNQEMMDKV